MPIKVGNKQKAKNNLSAAINTVNTALENKSINKTAVNNATSVPSLRAEVSRNEDDIQAIYDILKANGFLD